MLYNTNKRKWQILRIDSKIHRNIKMIYENEKTTLEITDFGDNGCGVGRIDGLIIFVMPEVGPDTVPQNDSIIPVVGDVLEIIITKMKKKYAVAKIISVKKPSPFRIDPKCKYAGQCGGCAFAYTSYNKQLEIKKSHVVDCLTRIGKFKDFSIGDIVSMDTPFSYRNKAVMHIATRSANGTMDIGFFKKNSHDVVDCKTCILQNDSVSFVYRALKKYAEGYGGCSEDDLDLRNVENVTVRTAFNTKEMMIIFDSYKKYVGPAKKMIFYLNDEINKSSYELKSLVFICNNKINNVIGSTHINEELIRDEKNGIHNEKHIYKFETSPKSFYQINPVMTVKLYDKISEYAGLTKDSKILDIYCGTGSIGIWCADSAKNVLGIESERQAVLDANRNSVINGIINTRYICGKAEVELPMILKGEKNCDVSSMVKEADTVIVDPPRSGCKDELLESIIDVNPQKIIYVSCEPSTLARDLLFLKNNGYSLKSVSIFDMFPWTKHVESVVLMSKVK